VGFVAPSKPVSADDWLATQHWWREQGFVPVAFFDLDARWGMFADDDAARTRYVQAALDCPTCKAVICVRGGYGLNRIMDAVAWTTFSRRPKWVCGFSDATPLLNAAAAAGGVAVHGAMFAGFAHAPSHDNQRALLQALTVLYPPSLRYQLPPHPLNRPGAGTGRAVGGNLALIHSNLSTPTELSFDGSVLFIEDVGEWIYHLDRMLGTLRRAGKLKNLAALVVGSFTDLQDNDPAFGQSWEQIIREAVAGYEYPVMFGMPAGHGAVNLPIYLGARVRVSVDTGGGVWEYL
jgi:muramoyltetrapeptide carboxypeptidase